MGCESGVHLLLVYRKEVHLPYISSSSLMASSHHSRRPRDASGTQMPVGRYTRLDEIGRGSFATVYQGVHTVSVLLLSLIGLLSRC